MSNPDTIPMYIMLAAFLAVCFWGTYKLTRPYSPKDDKTECECSK